MISFDGSAREVCLTRRIRTNTPLQALTLLNDSTYWDLSVKLAQNLLQDKTLSLEQKIGKGYALATGHPINEQKTKALQQLYASSYQKLNKEKEKYWACYQILFTENKARNWQLLLSSPMPY